MYQCKCPNCQSVLCCTSSDFGNLYKCIACGYEFKLDTPNLVRYVLPKSIEIQLKTKEGTPFKDCAVPVIVDYGYYIPPLLSDKNGHLIVTAELMLKAQFEDKSSDLMGTKYDDYALNRYLILRVPDIQQGSKKAFDRKNLGWPMTELEKQLFGNIKQLIAAFIPSKDILPQEILIDLSQEKENINLEIIVETQ